jgi:hypothetical protein
MRDLARIGLAAAAALAAVGCDRLGIGPEKAASAPPAAIAAAPPVDPQLREHAGDAYSDFVVASGTRYAPDALGLAATDRARLWRGMAASSGARLVTGGGAEALVFRGCADTGCGDGLAVVAIDTETGAAFAAVRDVGGADVLAPNDRLEALLRLTSPTRAWDDPAPVETASTETAQP